MAFYVLILKEGEDDKKVIYNFGPSEEKIGCLELSKKDGKIQEVRQVPVDNSSAFFTRAATKIYRHCKPYGHHNWLAVKQPSVVTPLLEVFLTADEYRICYRAIIV